MNVWTCAAEGNLHCCEFCWEKFRRVSHLNFHWPGRCWSHRYKLYYSCFSDVAAKFCTAWFYSMSHLNEYVNKFELYCNVSDLQSLFDVSFVHTRRRIVIHGGIDGYSHLVVFLKASDNNRKQTVLSSFLEATILCGLPSRIRVDHGGENNDVCDLMDAVRGANWGSAVRGSSVHTTST
jgi:hypothetical protein